MWIQLLLALMLLAGRGDELTDRTKAAGNDVGKLWELALWCEANEHADDAEKTFERILKIDARHAGAHEKLRHHRYDERWFETYRALADYRKAEEEQKARLGLVRHADGWVPAADLPFLLMGWERDAAGAWLDPVETARRAHDDELRAGGWQQQDLVWVAPAEFDSWRAGLFKCGDAWLDLEAADSWHAHLGREWQLPGERFVVRATVDRESARWAVWWADQAYPDLVRAVGLEPRDKPCFVTLKSLEQYNDLARGNAVALRPAAEVAGWSSVHYAFQADSYVDITPYGLQYVGAGVCYWAIDDPALKPYGQHAARHAAALAYLDAVDPSWNAVAQMIAAGPGVPVDPTAFWSEKRLPTWAWFGIASYCERYFRDANAAEGQSPWWPREWALENLRNQGGLRSLEQIFAFALDTNDPEGSARLIAEAGCVVAFVLDGECAPVVAAHGRVKELLAAGAGAEEVRAAVTELERTIAKNEKKLRRFAGL